MTDKLAVGQRSKNTMCPECSPRSPTNTSGRRGRHANETTKKIERLLDCGQWRPARNLLESQLRNAPQSHWLMARLAYAHCADGNLSEARDYVLRALDIAPWCPLVRWEYGRLLEAEGDFQAAIREYKWTLRKGLGSVAYGRCGEGVRWARSLLNDCRYRIHECCVRLGEYGHAARWLRKHLNNRAPGIPSDYDLALARARLEVVRGFAHDARRRRNAAARRRKDQPHS